ncbi:MAG TPA: hypothetical protein VE944_10595 [Nostoc sp.]|uniref:hypothetical protein n=1 Tax=Nostoc sp. TaxID=1180 RepID=UPI002D5BE8C7|nr:hypothetical protein [Nostoc sp.]HYX14798.1 hypothetical protein [Nostoc sp.]
MQPNLRYVGVVTLTLLSLLGFGMAYPDKNQVSTNAKLRYDSGEKARLNPSALKTSIKQLVLSAKL